jgi:NDP-sugar pyrophosphorylase family protein
MQAVILCGGKGTRLSTLYTDRPKVLVPVAGRPFLEWQLEWLERGGVTDVHLAAGHLSSVLSNWVEKYPVGLNITVSAEPVPLGTGGGLKYIESNLCSDPFFVLNGDSLMPRLDFHALVEAHDRFRARFDHVGVATLAVTSIEESGQYGTVEFNDVNRIIAFREKATFAAGWINGGVYLMSHSLLDGIPSMKSVSIETEVFPALAQLGRLQAFCAAPPLLDMGTPEGIALMERFLCY